MRQGLSRLPILSCSLARSLACSLSCSLLLGAVGLALPGGPASAQSLEPRDSVKEYAPPEYLRQPPTVPPQFSKQAPRPITLDEAIATALRNNLDIAIQRETVRQRDFLQSLALISFEPTLQLGVSRAKSKTPPTTSLDGRPGQVFPSTLDSWSLRLSEQLPTATRLTLDFANGRTDSTLGSAVAPLFFRSTLSFSVSQPILQGFSLNNHVQWAPVLRARFDSETAREAARLKAIATIKTTEDLYWNLVLSWKAYEVKRGAFALAEKQLTLTRRQIAAGLLAESESIRSESTLARNQVDMLTYEAAIEDAADRLRQQLNLPPAEWEQPLVPLDAPSFVPQAVAFSAAWERALASRPELKTLQIDRQRDSLALEVARNALLPSLSLSSSIAALGGDAQYVGALDQVAARSGWQWTVGLDFSWQPLGLAARAGVRSAQAGLRLDALQRELALTQIRLELRAALRSLSIAERKVYAAARSRDLAERSLEIEQRRFLNNISDNFKVAQLQGELELARQAELQALIDHEKARSELLRATGELLQARNLTFDLRHDS